MKKAAFFLFGLIFLSSITPTFADVGVKIEPKSFFIQAIPGKTVREVVTLKNSFSAPKNVYLAWQGYQLTEGKFTSETDRADHTINFARLNTKIVELQPQGLGVVEIEFEVPKDTLPADYYGALVAKGEGWQERADFTIRVLGRIEEKVEIAQFSAKGDAIILKIANRGNQTTDFRASIKIQDFLGRTKNLGPIKGGLKAAEIKTIQVKHAATLPGPYQAKIDFEFGSQKQEVVFYSFWIHPEIFLIAGAIIVIAVLIFLAKRRKKND